MKSEPRRRVVITGLGVVSAAGLTLETFWERLVSGTSSIRRIQRFDVSRYPSQIAGEIDAAAAPSLADLPSQFRDRGRIAQYAAAAVSAALEDAKLAGGASRARSGVSLAVGLGSYDHEEIFGACAAGRSQDSSAVDWCALIESLRELLKPHALARSIPGSIASLIAHHHGFTGPVMTQMTACAASTQAIGDALRWIRLGRADVVVAGGADSELYPMGLASFCLLGALSTRNDDPAGASRPFDAARDGFVLGEGAGVLVLEDLDHARRRGARIYAELAGFGAASDAYRATDPHPEGMGAILAMTCALNDAHVEPSEIDYVNAHGTSTVANDKVETLAIKKVFGEHARRLAISSTKSMIGHATVAAGALEAVATTLTLQHQRVHPTINQHTPDPRCDLDYVANVARATRVETALSNSFAFGGQSATLILRRDSF